MSYIDTFDPRKGKIFQIINKDGKVSNASAEPKLAKQDLLKLYEHMVLMRVADEKALKLQRSGRMGTFAQVLGQEAQVGVGLAMEKQDWLFPSFRENALMVYRGMPLAHFYLVFMGNEEGNRMPPDVRTFPIAVPVGSQTLHAVGAAWAAKIKKDNACTVGFIGDGATSEGDFHEAMNFAGVMQAPCVLICQNNQFAISTKNVQQTGSATFAEKAFAYGFRGIKVDGNDPLALQVIVKEALAHARKGNGPTLIEAYTYRLGPHTTSDDPTLYRTDKEVKEWEAQEPIKRFKKYLEKKGYWNKNYEEKIQNWAKEKVEAAVKTAENTKLVPKDMFQYMYKDMPEELQDQYNYLANVLDKGDAS